jgi:hypothetical protein
MKGFKWGLSEKTFDNYQRHVEKIQLKRRLEYFEVSQKSVISFVWAQIYTI